MRETNIDQVTGVGYELSYYDDGTTSHKLSITAQHESMHPKFSFLKKRNKDGRREADSNGHFGNGIMHSEPFLNPVYTPDIMRVLQGLHNY